MMRTSNAKLRFSRYSDDALDTQCSSSTCHQSSHYMFRVQAGSDQPERTNEGALLQTRNAPSTPAMLTRALAISVACAAMVSSPAFGESVTPTADPSWRQSVEQVIESYIQSHPEVIEHAQQALEAKRQEAENVRVKEAIATHRSELPHDPASAVSGDPAGEVTVVEFFDYRCGYCKRVANAVTQLQKEDVRVRVVYRV